MGGEVNGGVMEAGKPKWPGSGPARDNRSGVRFADAGRLRVLAAVRHTDRWWRTKEIQRALRRGGRIPSLRLVQAVLSALAAQGEIVRRVVTGGCHGGRPAEWRWKPGGE